jgi:hypothetical protein
MTKTNLTDSSAAVEIKRLKAELKRSQEEIKCARMLLERQRYEIDHSDAWIEELTARVNQKLIEAIQNVDAGIETLTMKRLNLMTPTRHLLSELLTKLTLLGSHGEIDVRELPSSDSF